MGSLDNLDLVHIILGLSIVAAIAWAIVAQVFKRASKLPGNPEETPRDSSGRFMKKK